MDEPVKRTTLPLRIKRVAITCIYSRLLAPTRTLEKVEAISFQNIQPVTTGTQGLEEEGKIDIRGR